MKRQPNILTSEIKEYIDKSVLCWLATTSLDNQPNVSPKEIFMAFDNASIIIANIASPQTVSNIKENNKVCVSFIDVLVQKGFQLKGTAQIINETDTDFDKCKNQLETMTKGKYPFTTVTKVSVKKVKRIVAPSYLFYSETTEANQIAAAKKTYGL